MRRPPVRHRLSSAALTLVLGAGVIACSGEPDNEPSDDTRTADPDRTPTANPPATDASPSAPASPPGTQQARRQPGQTPKPTEMATGLTGPWGLVELPDGTVLVSERDSKQIKAIRGNEEPRVVRTIDAAVPDGEGGLLGLTATPDGTTVFAYYTAAEENRVVAMSWDGTDLGDPETIFDGIPIGDGDRHEGGRMTIGPDGLLYVGTGETGDSPEISQDRDNLGGKILRLTTEGEPAPDNPFGTAVYSLGHRNVQGLAFDDDGNLWASEFGDNRFDELNLIEAGGNYGWPEVEGSSRNPDFVNPAVVWATEDNSPSGLEFWDGSLWMAGLRGETLWEIPLPGDGRTADPVPHFRGEYGRLRSVTRTAANTLLLTTSNTDGRGDPDDGDDRLIELR